MPSEDVRQMVSQVRGSMANVGVHLRESWIAHYLRETAASGVRGAGDGYGRGSCDQAQEEIYRIFLACDLREAGIGCLPAGVVDMVKGRIKGKVVLQVEGARDIAKTFEQREEANGASAHHTLKLALGDGKQTVAAFEYRRIQGLCADPPLGLKVLVIEPWVRRGILLLTSENTMVLGGQVSALVKARDEARERKTKTGSAGTAETTAGAGRGISATISDGGPGPTRSPGAAGEQGQADRRRVKPKRASAVSEPGTADRPIDETQGGRDRHGRSPPGSSHTGVSSSRRPVVANPYAASSSVLKNDPPRSQSVQGSGSQQDRKRKLEARVPAFMEDDDGPAFEYLEEENFNEDPEAACTGDEEQLPPDDDFGVSAAPIAPSAPSAPPSKLRPQPPSIIPLPKIVSAREQGKRLKAEATHRGGPDLEVIDAELEFETMDNSSRVPREARSEGKGAQLDSSGERESTRTRPPLRSPYTSLADLEDPTVSRGLYRVKTVVADTVACKIRKKAYRLVIDIEDGTAVMRVRLCESIGKRLFGVEAREYRKMFQTDPERAQEIQSRVENDIREIEGVMELDMSPVTTATQSSPAPDTPGGIMSQGGAAGDAELSLPVVMSVSPPTTDDYRELLAHVEAF